MTTTIDTAADPTGESSPVARVSTSTHPIVPGFHPDPSVVRVGDDFWLAHSSFEYSPGVPIWHSLDLIDWTLVGNALDRDDQRPAGGARASGGVYAPTLRHHAGRFWLITTDVSAEGQLVVSAEDPRGPWSTATILRGLPGIDPDLAWDEDGRCLVTWCANAPGLTGIAQVEVDLERGVVLSEPRVIYGGTGMAFPEAPHLYRVDGWWYLVLAEGGTERGHTVTVARSRTPDGPFEANPSNPVLTHRSLAHPVQNTGHADLVELADGTWATVYLGVRPRGVTPMFHVLGRETFLAGVDWVDGWPVVDEGRFAATPRATSFVDRFEAPALHPRWVSPGGAPRAFASAGDGLRLRAGVAESGAPDALVARVLDLDWAAEADVDVSGGDVALLLRLDDRHWCEVRAAASGAIAVARIGPLKQRVGGADGTVTRVGVATAPSLTAGPDDLLLSAIVDGAEVELARVDGRYLSTEVAGGFTGRVVGLRGVAGAPRVAEFRYEGLDAAPGR